MLVRLESGEWRVIGRGLLGLFACVVLGSILVEIQLNELTNWLEFVQVFNFKQVDSGAYLAYIFGGEYFVQVAWRVGTIANTARSLDITLLGIGLSLPTQASFDLHDVASFSQLFYQQGIEEAFRIKASVGYVWTSCEPYLREALVQVSEFIR